MKSYTQGRNLYSVWSKNTSSANLLQGDQIANDDYRTIMGLRDWPFLTRQRNLSTVASQQFYTFPYDCDLPQEIAVILSTKRYVPRKAPSQAFWDQLNFTAYTSDIPQWWFPLAGQIGLWPKPASSSNTIVVTQKTRVIDLAAADYTTGTITTIATAGIVTTVTGSGTAWSAAMVGRWIRITPGDAANLGDGLWYEIASVPSATTLTLVRTYGGTAITAGSASYTIGQMPLLPENFHDLPWIYAAGNYWMKESDRRASGFLTMHGDFPEPGKPATGKLKSLIDSYGNPTTDLVIDDGGTVEMVNPNLTITL